MSTARAWTPSRKLPCLLAALVGFWVPLPTHAQGGGDVGAAWGGGALGALSGLGLGLVGAVPPCSLSLDGATCARVAAAVAGGIGAAGGAVLGYHDPDALRGRLIGAGVGAAAGMALGLGARAAVRQIQPRDVAAMALAGAALGAAPRGAALGLGAGLLAGSALWLIVPEAALPETLAMGIVGMALGGLMEWALAAASEASEPGGASPFALRLSIGF